MTPEKTKDERLSISGPMMPIPMKTKTTFFHSGEQLQKTLQNEINEIRSVVERIEWFRHSPGKQ